MALPPIGRPRLAAQAERVVVTGSPMALVLSSSLLLCCLVTVPDVARRWTAMRGLNGAVAGWAALAAVLALATAAASLALNRRLGSGPPLALGAVSAGLGLALSSGLTAGAQLDLALLTLAVGVGALYAAGLCLLSELPPRAAARSLGGWLLPLAAGWPVLSWLVLRTRTTPEASLAVHAPEIWLGLWIAVLVGWALLTLVLEPPPARSTLSAAERASWQTAWAALAVLVMAAGSVGMLLGFQPGLAVAWARPVILLVSALVIAGLFAIGWLMPDAMARSGFVAVVVALAVGPACVGVLMLVSVQGSGALSGPVVGVLALAGLTGAGVGLSRPRTGTTFGLVVLALGAAAGWVMPSAPWLMVAAAAPLAAGLAAAVTGGIRLAAKGAESLHFVSMAALAALLLGLVTAGAVTWSLGAQLTGPATDARPGGRVLLGLAFALSLPAAAGCAVLAESASPSVAVPAQRDEPIQEQTESPAVPAIQPSQAADDSLDRPPAEIGPE